MWQCVEMVVRDWLAGQLDWLAQQLHWLAQQLDWPAQQLDWPVGKLTETDYELAGWTSD